MNNDDDDRRYLQIRRQYDDEPDRCELDHRDGGVCLRILRADGTCPGEDDHR